MRFISSISRLGSTRTDIIRLGSTRTDIIRLGSTLTDIIRLGSFVVDVNVYVDDATNVTQIFFGVALKMAPKSSMVPILGKYIF